MDVAFTHNKSSASIRGLDILIIFSVVLAFCGLTFHIFYFKAPSVLITFFSLFILGIIFFLKSGKTTPQLFLISFCFNISISAIITYYFIYLNGIPFSEGGDDFTFYDLTIHWLEGISKFDSYAIKEYGISWSTIEYKLYIQIFGNWFKFLNSIGIESNHFFHLNILNCWFGAFAAPLIFLITNKVASPKVAQLTSLFVLIYSPLIFYSSIIIRDTLIITLFLLIVWVAIKQMSSIKKAIIILLLIYFIIYLRNVSALFAIIFILTFFISKSRIKQIRIFLHKKFIIIIIGLIVLVAAILIATNMSVLKNIDFFIFNNVVRYYEFYKQHAVEQGSGGSIGLFLKQSNNPFIFIISVFYIYLSPIPPEFIKKMNLINLFLGYGNILWYIIGPTFFIAVLQEYRSRGMSNLLKSTLICLLVSLIFIAMTSGNVRHLYFLHPLIAMFSINYAVKYKMQFIYLLFILGVTGVIAAALYFLIKFA